MCVFTRCQLYLNKTVLTITKHSKKTIPDVPDGLWRDEHLVLVSRPKMSSWGP